MAIKKTITKMSQLSEKALADFDKGEKWRVSEYLGSRTANLDIGNVTFEIPAAEKYGLYKSVAVDGAEAYYFVAAILENGKSFCYSVHPQRSLKFE